MITYLVDTSALWHLFRTPGALRPWEGHIAAGVFHLCEPTRAEFLYSATSPARRDELAEELDALCVFSPVPKNAWRWVDTAQYKLTQQGQHRAAGPTGLHEPDQSFLNGTLFPCLFCGWGVVSRAPSA